MGIPRNLPGYIATEVSIIGSDMRNMLLSHSREGGNPVLGSSAHPELVEWFDELTMNGFKTGFPPPRE